MNMEISLCKEREDYFSVNQYTNIQNTDAHYNTLGPEIWSQTKGNFKNVLILRQPKTHCS